MIVVRAPLRVSLAGGGTDLPPYYQRFGGGFVATSVTRYVHVALHRPLLDDGVAYHNHGDTVGPIDRIGHSLTREAVRSVGAAGSLRIASFDDIPQGVGMGGSGAYTVALLIGLHAMAGRAQPSPVEVAEEACAIELERAGRPAGKQDAYTSALGGLRSYVIDRRGAVSSRELSVPSTDQLARSLLLFFTGIRRDSHSILARQQESIRLDRDAVVDKLRRIHALVEPTEQALQRGDLVRVGRLLNEQWQHKRQLDRSIASDRIDSLYRIGLAHGAVGGRLLGAGGGGVLLLLTLEPDRDRVIRAMREADAPHIPIGLDHGGAILTQASGGTDGRRHRACGIPSIQSGERTGLLLSEAGTEGGVPA